ncbi:MAG TPA: hypothetical protein DF383_07145 [Deltaproteobacteria bacterium]|nr:hypothetical protein [Deltaproteobacteria bacterium]
MWFLAVRYLFSRKRQTLFVLLGVVLGSTAYVVISGIMAGFQSYIVEQLVNNDAHVRVNPGERFVKGSLLAKANFPDAAHVFWNTTPSASFFNPRIESPLRWFQFLEKEPEVVAFTPQLVHVVTLKRTGQSTKATLIGTDYLKQAQVTSIGNYMIEGSFEELGRGKSRLILGSRLLRKLGANPGDTIFIVNDLNESFPFQVVGVFQTGVNSFDENSAFTTLADAQSVLHAANQVSDIAIRLKNLEEARNLAGRWGGVFSDKIRSWDQINANFLAVFSLQQMIGFLMIAAILAVTGFGIYNTLFMLISHKRQEIGILRALGYDSRDIRRLFIYQGLCFGILGGLLGCALGYLSCRYIQTISIESLKVSQAGKLIISYAPFIYMGAFLVAFLSCFISSILPARAAGRLSPMDVIRTE